MADPLGGAIRASKLPSEMTGTQEGKFLPCETAPPNGAGYSSDG